MLLDPVQYDLDLIKNNLDVFKIVWMSPNWFGPFCFGQDQNVLEYTQKHLFTTEFYILNQVQKIWSYPNQFGPILNNFGQIEGQGIECTV